MAYDVPGKTLPRKVTGEKYPSSNENSTGSTSLAGSTGLTNHTESTGSNLSEKNGKLKNHKGGTKGNTRLNNKLGAKLGEKSERSDRNEKMNDKTGKSGEKLKTRINIDSCNHLNRLLASTSHDMAIKAYSQAIKLKVIMESNGFKILKENDYNSQSQFGDNNNTNTNNNNNSNKRKIDISNPSLKTLKNIEKDLFTCTLCGDIFGIKLICLQCSQISCLANKHSLKHAKSTGHLFGIEETSGNIYCHSCHDFVLHPVFNKVRNECIQKYRNKNLIHQFTSKELSLIKENTKDPDARACNGLRGLQNLGATCFMSVILQSLIHNPIVRNDFLSGGHDSRFCKRENCMGCRLDEIFTEFYTSTSTLGYGPSKLLATAWKTQRNLAGYSEQDAHEFLQFILNQLHLTSNLVQESEVHGSIMSNGDGNKPIIKCNCIVHRAFCGLLQSDITCKKCNSVKTTYDPMMDLSLDINSTESEVLLEDCLRKFTASEKLDTKLTCSSCKSPQEVEKKLLIKRLPVVLCIQLKRFQHKTSVSSKIDKHVSFPLQIDFNSYTSNLLNVPDDKHVSKKKKTKNGSVSKGVSSRNNHYIYELFAVIVHHGLISTGHYTCYIKNNQGLWFHFDDTMITLVEESTVRNSQAYLLIYIIKNIS